MFNKFFWKFDCWYFMVYNCFVIVNVKVGIGKVSVSYKNYSIVFGSIGN